MKTIGMALVAGMVFLSQLLNAQTIASDSIIQVTAEAQGLTQLPPDQIPPFGTFWLMSSNGLCPAPLPCLPSDPNAFPVYQIADGQFLVDGTSGENVSEAILEAQANAVVYLINQVSERQVAHPLMRAMNMDIPSPGDGGTSSYSDFGGGFVGYSFDTNQLWLEITNVVNGFAKANLHNATNQVYAMWATTDLAVPFSLWQVAAEVWPTDTNCMPVAVPTLNQPTLFLRAQDWTGVDSDGDDIPDWWIWKYFGDLSETATNLDGQGNNLGYDYTNGIDPNPIFFELTATNFYSHNTQTPVQIALQAGVPSYVAIMRDDADSGDAVWLPYSSSNIVVTLGATNGVWFLDVCNG